MTRTTRRGFLKASAAAGATLALAPHARPIGANDDLRVAVVGFRGQAVAGHTDVRKLLESKEVDAITTATPDHWHALVTVWGCQANKDVYVEKPLSHNLWEGRKMVEAARKYDRVVQFGNQNHGVKTGALRLEMEGLGKIRAAVTNLSRLRKSIVQAGGSHSGPAD